MMITASVAVLGQGAKATSIPQSILHMAPADLRPFKLVVPEEQLDDLKRRISSMRWPDQLHEPANSNWEYGTEMSYLRGLAEYWRTNFNWRAQEELFNTMPQFTATIRGSTLHFVHQRCTGNPNSPALLICHGWPGSVFEFCKVLSPLAESFHVVAPSMPGYGFSEAPHVRGFGVPEVGRTFHTLMMELGYTEYVAQGGDWGSIVVQTLAKLFPKHCKAIHIQVPYAGPPKDFDWSTVSAKEKESLRFAKAFRDYGKAYQDIQGTCPQTLSYGLNDSPVGLLAWIVEKFRNWSDCGGNVESVFTRDELLTNVMIYWVSQSIGSSMRLYYETLLIMPGTSKEMVELRAIKVPVPTAVAMFPREPISYSLKSWCEKLYNLHQYTTFDAGGHFAAMEKPEELVKDIKMFFIEKLSLGNAQSKL